MQERRVYTLTGQVQGVGFRPFVYRSAVACGLSGHVGNSPKGVCVEVQGSPGELDRFEQLLHTSLPPLARVSGLEKRTVPIREGETGFTITVSEAGEHHGHRVLVSPDVAVCDQCLADTLNPASRRYGYAFTNCTDCGPRYSITRSIPYDRPMTSMACFPLCEDCRREYEDPLDRRFHAQPNACPVCGPRIWLQGEGLETVYGPESIPMLLDRLREGAIAAIKGLGGFHLACDALNAGAVAELRRRKQRPHKALAVMTADLQSARRLACISPQAEILLLSVRRPIVICPRLPGILPPLLSPDTADIGLMLPPTPLHHLLFHPEAVGGRVDQALPALVMTSGNAGGEPICLGNREAARRLSGIADIFLFHDRDILVRVDDSVAMTPAYVPGTQTDTPPILIRRARGYVPEPILLPVVKPDTPCVFAAGAQLKHTFCLTRGREAFVSQHIGDLAQPASLDFFEETLRHLESLLETDPVAVIRDLHPDYPSSRLAEEYARQHGLPVLGLQHHFAHIWSVLAEHGGASPEPLPPVLGLALDGSGLGEDGSIWGGELLWVDMASGKQRRVGHFTPFPLPGGEAAIHEPWRVAEALWRLAELPDVERPWSRSQSSLLPLVGEMIRRGVHCPSTSSCGRLFDAVSALCGLCFAVSYEGQAALLLEGACSGELPDLPRHRLVLERQEGKQNCVDFDSVGLFRAVAEARLSGLSTAHTARFFHEWLAQGLADWARAGADVTGSTTVVLAGGVMQNRTLVASLTAALRGRGLNVLLPVGLPPGDGGIALGQAAWARARLARLGKPG